MPVELDSQGRAFTDLMKGQDVRRVSARLPWWEFRYGTSPSVGNCVEYEARRREVLAAVVAGLAPLYLIFDENPVDDCLAGEWGEAGLLTWLVPPDPAPEELYRWLYVGAWWLYSRATPLVMDECRLAARDDGIEPRVRFIESKDVAFLLASAQDNDPWDLIINPPLWPSCLAGPQEGDSR